MMYLKTKACHGFIKDLIIWVWRAWPFIIILLFAAFHFIIINACSPDRVDKVNEIISTFTQIIGGLIILSNINSNLGLFTQTTFMHILFNWTKSCPLPRKIKTIKGNMYATLPCFTGSAEGHTSRVCKNLEEKIEEAQRQIDELRNIVYQKERELISRISDTKMNLLEKINGNQSNITELSNLVKISKVGGIKIQIFGVLLVLYMPILSLI